MTDATISLRELEVGGRAGLWWVPEEGVVWRSDVIPIQPPETAREHGPWLVARGDRLRYAVLKRRGLLAAFERLGHDATQDAIARFAETYGLLGIERPLQESRREDPILGEALTRWQAEARWFATLRQIAQWVRTRDTGKIAECIEWTRDPVGVAVKFVSVAGRVAPEYRERVRFWGDQVVVGALPRDGFHQAVDLVRRVHDPDDRLSNWKTGDVLAPMRYYLHEMVNVRLRDQVSPMLVEDDHARVRIVPRTLLGAIYLRFATEVIAADPEERECENPHCPNGGLFLPGRRDQRYCDKNCRNLASYLRRATARVRSQRASSRSVPHARRVAQRSGG